MKRAERPKLKDKVAIVTGASSGIGEAAGRELGRAGAKVVLAARRADRLERLADEIRSQGGVALAVPTDLTEADQIKNLVQTTLSTFGRIDVLANIAGWGHYDWFEELPPESLRNQFEVNVLGLAELTRQVIPTMKRQRSGHILNMSSYASKIAVPPLTVYASTKYAIEGLTDALRRELKPWGIHLTRVHPSGVKGTEFNQRAAQNGGIRYRSAPVGKVTREQVAKALVRLVERPQRALFMSRLYDVPVLVNLLLPGLVDFASSTWVSMKRKNELRANSSPAAKPAVYKAAPLALPLVVLSGIAALIAWTSSKSYINRRK